jgi:hypothetical protein
VVGSEGGFVDAQGVFEFGAGAGEFAEQLLDIEDVQDAVHRAVVRHGEQVQRRAAAVGVAGPLRGSSIECHGCPSATGGGR